MPLGHQALPARPVTAAACHRPALEHLRTCGPVKVVMQQSLVLLSFSDVPEPRVVACRLQPCLANVNHACWEGTERMMWDCMRPCEPKFSSCMFSTTRMGPVVSLLQSTGHHHVASCMRNIRHSCVAGRDGICTALSPGSARCPRNPAVLLPPPSELWGQPHCGCAADTGPVPKQLLVYCAAGGEYHCPSFWLSWLHRALK